MLARGRAGRGQHRRRRGQQGRPGRGDIREQSRSTWACATASSTAGRRARPIGVGGRYGVAPATDPAVATIRVDALNESGCGRRCPARRVRGQQLLDRSGNRPAIRVLPADHFSVRRPRPGLGAIGVVSAWLALRSTRQPPFAALDHHRTSVIGRREDRRSALRVRSRPACREDGSATTLLLVGGVAGHAAQRQAGSPRLSCSSCSATSPRWSAPAVSLVKTSTRTRLSGCCSAGRPRLSPAWRRAGIRRRLRAAVGDARCSLANGQGVGRRCAPGLPALPADDLTGRKANGGFGAQLARPASGATFGRPHSSSRPALARTPCSSASAGRRRRRGPLRRCAAAPATAASPNAATAPGTTRCAQAFLHRVRGCRLLRFLTILFSTVEGVSMPILPKATCR